jgi:serine/threonine protein kinase
MAAVYRATDVRTGGMVAIKEMSDTALAASPQDHAFAVQSFQQEAHLLSTLSHPNLPRVSDYFVENNKHYLVMEFVEGQSLCKFQQQQGRPFSEAEVVPWAIQLCDVLTYLHTHNPPIIFRDLKPDNIMRTPTGQVKLIDFGIVRFFKANKAKDTQALGTTGYAAPEAINGQTESRSDIYSLCATLLELLTGFDPTSQPLNLPLARKINPAVSREMEQILQRGLNLNLQQRFSSAAEMRNQLGNLKLSPGSTPFQAGTNPGGGSSGLPRTSRPTTRLLMAAVKLSSKQLIGILAGIVVLLVIAAWTLTPILRSVPFDWNIFPIFAMFGAMAYAAYPHRGIAFVAHSVLTGALTLTIAARSISWFTAESLISSLLVSGLFMEVWLFFLARIKGKSGPEAWKREMAWYAGMGAPVVLAFFYIAGGGSIGMNPLSWLFGCGFSAFGWFLGDLVNQYVLYRQIGYRRIP